ncbi:MAG: ABC transporter ATP-binding protein [Saprospiraceae bacterium]|nr:ABC transporter ATP-binding protein [Saprospiraceae bacterium]
MIHLDHLNYHYTRSRPLFTDLQLYLSPGHIYGLLGRNGAGKTTLLRLIAGLLFPKDGICEVGNWTPSDRHPDFLSDVFFMPEEIYVPDLKITQFLRNYAPFYPKFDRTQFDKFIGTFGLRADENMRKLSYGQKKKVMLGFGLASGASVLILDEPTNGLDIPSKAQFRQILSESITDDRIIILSTHQVRDVSTLIERLILLDNGKILFQDSLLRVSEKLAFNIYPKEPKAGSVYYAERIPGGYMAVEDRAASVEEDTDIDLEVLFNALITDPGKITQLFNVQA